MAESEFFHSIGIKIPELVSGLAGGMVNALYFQRSAPMDAVSSTIGGAITANYLAGPASHVVGHVIGSPLDVGVAGFIVGITAMAICQGILASVRVWMKRLQFGQGGKPDV